MYKTKLITKSYEHRDDRTRQDREEKRERVVFQSDSQEDSSAELQELDFNCFCSSEDESYSIQNFIENLRAEKTSFFPEEEENEEDSNSAYHTSTSSLERINAQYMQMMSKCPAAVAPSCHIKFDSSVRFKFFNDQLPVVEICRSQQYTFSNDQYQQTSDEDRLS